MAEIEITLPTVQYGNVKVRATPEELGVNDISDSYELGVAAAVYLNLFQQGFKHGATLDVTAPQGAAQSEAGPSAQELLDEGLGGVTEVPEGAAPWDKPVVDAPAKPWETEAATW